MNTQNIPKQNNIDYLKDLKDVNKEIDKIYKKLSKDEPFADILENIKTDFIKNNIAIIQENLSKSNLTNYKDFNGKIIKMLEILKKLLIGYTSYKDNSAENEVAVTAINLEINDKKIIVNTPTDAEKAKNPQATTSYQRISRDELNKIIDNNEKFFKIKVSSHPKDATIIKNICMFNYYLDIFEKNDKYGIDLDKKIKDLNDSIASLIKSGAEKRSTTTNGNEDYNTLNREKDEVKKYNEDNKKIYKELFDYIQLATFDIFENLSDTAEEAEKIEKTQGKDKTDNKTYIENFKNEIYYEIININNFQVNDDYAKLKENSNEKIDLDLRKKTLADMKDLLDKQLNKLHVVIEYLISAKKEEYSAEIIDIRKTFKDYSKEKEYKDSILTLIVNEETEVNKLLTRNSDDKKRLETLSKQQRGGEKKSNKYYEEKYTDIKVLNNKIANFIKKIKEVEGIEDSSDPFEKKNTTMFGDASEGVTSIYKNIWNDYVKDTKKTKSKGTTVENLKIDNRLYERFKENDLDPNDVLKVSFQDKVIFICIILIIRTFAIVFIEFLIEYNIVSTLYRGIVVYLVIYIFLIICCVLLINYDSYKLRILVNYLNLHINSSNIFFHILLFILFIGLILIIINNNDLNNMDIDNVLNYTYIYKYIYEIAEKSKPMSDLILSQKEKVKLQYRLDIITMIIFIFSSLLILIM
jgi:hypothetical protein